MSAFYSFSYPEHVHLLTDGGFFDDQGVLRLVRSKVRTSPHWPFAITGRGTCASTVFDTIDKLFEYVDGYASFSDMDSILEMAQAFFDDLKRREIRLEAEFMIAYFSETSGAGHCFVQCHGHWSDVPTFKLVSPGKQIAGGPAIGFSDIAHLGLSADQIASPDFPENYGVHVMEAMRRKRGSVPGNANQFFGVGGHCDLTTVDATGAKTRRLHTWPDQIGFPIMPTNGELV